MIYLVLLLISSTQAYGSIRVARGSYFRPPPPSYSLPSPSYQSPNYPSQTYSPSVQPSYPPQPTPSKFIPSYGGNESVSGPLPPLIPSSPSIPTRSHGGPPSFK